MDKIEKFLKKLTKKERTVLNEVIERVRSGDLSGLNIKKLQGHAGLFRVRVGALRAIFYKEEDVIKIIFVGRRDKDTYKS